MIPENQKLSLNIADRQLPGFVCENSNYEKFISFLEAYYDWMAETNNIEDRSKNLLNYKDIDETLDEFETHFFNEFLRYFPEETLANKRELVKLSKHFYRRKSTESSFKFLFRALYNTDIDVYNTRQSILIASDGKWLNGIYLILNSIDLRYLRTKGLKIFGETSKAIATIERIYPKHGRLELNVSNIIREFYSGEVTRIIDNDLSDVYFDALGNIVTTGGELLKSSVVGNITHVTIDPDNRGKYYQITDPVVFIGGINPEIQDDFTSSARASVSEISLGKLNNISVIDGSNGFRHYPNTEIQVNGDGSGAIVKIASLDTTSPANVVFWGIETISSYSEVFLDAISYGFPNLPTANANTIIAEALSNIDFTTYPIASLDLISSGVGYTYSPDIQAESYFDVGSNTRINIKDLGILCPIQINNGGFNFELNDEILLVGGSGVGAFANVTNIDANGSITKIEYYQNPNVLFPLGGMGYNNTDLPEIISEKSTTEIILATNSALTSTNVIELASVANVKIGMKISGNGISTLTTITDIVELSNTVIISSQLENNIFANDEYIIDFTPNLVVKSILGDGEQFDISVQEYGNILKINVDYQGDNYISTPEISLKVLDVLVLALTNVEILPPKGSFVYQSYTDDATNYSFYGFFDNLVKEGDNYRLRLYNYANTIVTNVLSRPLYIDTTSTNSKDYAFDIVTEITNSHYTNGVKYYGDGSAKASASLLSGVYYGKGEYLNTDGFLSADKVLESNIYNDFTYFLTIQKTFEDYKAVVKNILHPAGTQLIGRDIIGIHGNQLFDTITEIPGRIELKYITYPTIFANLFYGENINVDYLRDYSYLNISGIDIFNSNFSDLPISTENDDTILIKTYFGSPTYPVGVSDINDLPKPTNILEFFDVNSDITGVKLSQVIGIDSYITFYSDDGEYFTSQVSRVNDDNNLIYLYDYKIVSYINVATGFTGTEVLNTIEASNTITITALTGIFDLINNGDYSNTQNHLIDVVKPGDFALISNNVTKQIINIDYEVSAWKLYFAETLNLSGNNLYPEMISIVRNFSANSIIVDTSNTAALYLSAAWFDLYNNYIDGFFITSEDKYLEVDF